MLLLQIDSNQIRGINQALCRLLDQFYASFLLRILLQILLKGSFTNVFISYPVSQLATS